MNHKKHNISVPFLAKSVLALLTVGFMLASCGQKKDEEKTLEDLDREIAQQARDERAEIIRMPNVKENKSLQANGHTYAYSIIRTSCDSLGIVTDSDGFRTVDNSIQLYITRDGALMFNKTFTRRAFKIGISDREFSHYVLSNMAFDRATTSGLQFIVTLCEGSADDLYIPFALTVAPDGSTNIAHVDAFNEEDISRFED